MGISWWAKQLLIFIKQLYSTALVHDFIILNGILNKSDIWKPYAFISTIIIYVCFYVKKSSFYSSLLFGSESSATRSACLYMYGAQMLCASNILILCCLMCFMLFNF